MDQLNGQLKAMGENPVHLLLHITAYLQSVVRDDQQQVLQLESGSSWHCWTALHAYSRMSNQILSMASQHRESEAQLLVPVLVACQACAVPHTVSDMQLGCSCCEETCYL